MSTYALNIVVDPAAARWAGLRHSARDNSLRPISKCCSRSMDTIPDTPDEVLCRGCSQKLIDTAEGLPSLSSRFKLTETTSYVALVVWVSGVTGIAAKDLTVSVTF